MATAGGAGGGRPLGCRTLSGGQPSDGLSFIKVTSEQLPPYVRLNHMELFVLIRSNCWMWSNDWKYLLPYWNTHTHLERHVCFTLFPNMGTSRKCTHRWAGSRHTAIPSAVGVCTTAWCLIRPNRQAQFSIKVNPVFIKQKCYLWKTRVLQR